MERQDSEQQLMKRSMRAVLNETGILLRDQAYRTNNASLETCLSCTSIGEGDNGRPPVIPYSDVLNVNRCNDGELEITFTQKQGVSLVPITVSLLVEATGLDDVVQHIMEQSYKGTTPGKRVMVLVNPHGGKGKALRVFLKLAKPILDAAGCAVEVIQTTHFRHAVEIVKEMDISRYDVIACASGDGVPHEVFNGLYLRADRAKALNTIAVTQLPCGSGNAMSESCHGTNDASVAALSLVKAQVVNIDLMAVTQRGKTTVSFLSQTIGVIADADLTTEYLRFLGSMRFELGVTYGVLRGTKYPCDIAMKYAAKSKDAVRQHYDRYINETEETEFEITEDKLTLKYDANDDIPEDWEIVDTDLTNNLGIFYTGKMPLISRDTNFFPAALPTDGAIDIIMIDSRTPLTRQTPILLSLDTGKHVNAPEVHHSKVEAYRLTPKYSSGCLSVDGERYPCEEVQVEVLSGAAKTLMKNGMFRPDTSLSLI